VRRVDLRRETNIDVQVGMAVRFPHVPNGVIVDSSLPPQEHADLVIVEPIVVIVVGLQNFRISSCNLGQGGLPFEPTYVRVHDSVVLLVLVIRPSLLVADG
jgi:hypothetical protein